MFIFSQTVRWIKYDIVERNSKYYEWSLWDNRHSISLISRAFLGPSCR